MLISCLEEQDLRKRFQSDRVESVRSQTLIPLALPAWLTWMTGLPEEANMRFRSNGPVNREGAELEEEIFRV